MKEDRGSIFGGWEVIAIGVVAAGLLVGPASLSVVAQQPDATQVAGGDSTVSALESAVDSSILSDLQAPTAQQQNGNGNGPPNQEQGQSSNQGEGSSGEGSNPSGDDSSQSDQSGGNGNGQSDQAGGDGNGNGNGQSDEAGGNSNGNGNANGQSDQAGDNGNGNGNGQSDEAGGNSNGNGNGNGQSDQAGGNSNGNGNGNGQSDQAGGNGNGNGPPDQARGNGNGNGNGPPGQARGNGNGNGNGPPDQARGNGSAGAPGRGPPSTVPATVNVSSRGEGNRANTVLNASVRNVSAGERGRIDLRPRRERPANAANGSEPGVGVTAMELTPTRSGSFTLNVTTGRDIDGSPEFGNDSGTEVMSHIRVNHSISNEEVNGTVDIDFRVDRDRLDNGSIDPGDVALYRYENGSWTELNTTVMNITEETVRFRAESPGLSEFAAGAKRARFTVETVDMDVERIEVGDDLRVRVWIANDGSADGAFDAQLLLNDTVVEERSLTIAADGQRRALFVHPATDAGKYEVRVNDVTGGTVVVRSAERSKLTAEERASTEAGSTNRVTTSATEMPGPIFHPVALLVAVVCGLGVRILRR